MAGAASFTGLTLVIDWYLTPAASHARGPTRDALVRIGLPVVGAARWSGALAWVMGMTYALGFLARQDPQGTAHWLGTNTRGQWIGLSFGLASLAIAAVWFFVAPRWEAAARAAAAPADETARDAPVDELIAAGRAARFATSLLPPLLFAMGAARHLGETGGELPTDFATAAAAVTAAGVLLGLCLGRVFGRRP